ncbi:hypothetical protein [Photobacterium nomapromontoriensis]|uniref:hypothetical protein n=1 Tax=Photobacterium nomapromontoriensis TaxID=2910237 RepID=UPI003D12ACC3
MTTNNEMPFIQLKEKVRGCIAVSNNPFDSKEESSTDITFAALNVLLDTHDKKQVLRELNRYHMELANILDYEPGSMTAAEMMMVDKERLTNCNAAIKHLETAY